jgi:tetratricopeptide (TPR) repeat protein
MTRIIFAALLSLALPALAFAQSSTEIRKMFESGQYAQVVDAAGASDTPDVLYAAAQSAQKQGNQDGARGFYDRLADLPEDSPWNRIGISGRQLLADDTDGARDAAQQAVDRDGNLAEAHYQLGLVLARRQEWAAAAQAFDRAADLSPSMAYAHYYGGLMHYRANRPDRMANHFEYFLKLAPNAPERPEVMQIMKTVRGR